LTLKRRTQKAVQRFGRFTVNKIAIPLVIKGVKIPGITGSVLVLVTTGRKTAQKRMTPMGYVASGQDKLLVVAEHGAGSDWVKNALAAGTVEIWIEGVSRKAVVRLAEGEDPDAVRRRIRSRMVAMANRALSSDSKVVEIALASHYHQRQVG